MKNSNPVDIKREISELNSNLDTTTNSVTRFTKTLSKQELDSSSSWESKRESCIQIIQLLLRKLLSVGTKEIVFPSETVIA